MRTISARRSGGDFVAGTAFPLRAGLRSLAAILVLTTGLHTALAQCTASWSGATPTARYGHSMAYDSARAVTVIFGGSDGNLRFRETWEWNGTVRTLRNNSGPAERESASMAYDPVRGVTVMFGGFNGSALNDTWEWNGSTWIQRVITGPGARYGHAMVFNAARGTVMLFGGYDGANYKSDTWEYNGTSWVQIAAPGPSGRRYHAMAYDSNRQRVVLHGGDNGAYSRETWELAGLSWQLMANNAPALIANAALAYDAESQVVVFFGGYNGSYNGETWSWNGSAWSLRSTTGPTARALHAMAYDASRDRVVAYGGQKASGNDGELWEWNQNASSWTLRTSGGPSPRYWHAMAYDVARQQAVLFGGQDGFGISGETWTLDSANWTQHVAAGPTPRYWHAQAYDIARSVTVLFGGNTGARNGETWEWNGTSWTQRMVSGPSGRDGHAMAYDAARNRVVLFGGRDVANQTKQDTWEWDGTTWTLRSNTGPTARYWHAMAYDSNRQRIVLFGGIDSIGLKKDIWEWDGTIWTLRTAPGGPTARSGAVLVYDANRGRAVVHGGYDGLPAADTWEINLGANPAGWISQPPGGPSPRQRHAGCFALNRSAVVVFGGTLTGAGQLGDSWQYGASGGFPSITSQPQALTRCLGQSASFSVTASGTGLSYQWRKNSTNIGGATSATFNIAAVTAADAANYDVVVTNACGSVSSAIVALTVSSAPTVSSHPQSITRCVGVSASFSVTASGAGLSYQWRKGTTPIGGATASTFDIPSVTAGDAGNYDCVITSSCGNVTSNAATLTVQSPPTINTHPQAVTICEGQDTLFSVSATGDGQLTYQWRRNSTPLLNANSPSFEVALASPSDAGTYDCVVTNGCGSVTSNGALLTISAGPQISQQPAAASRCVGQSVTFNVTASGAPPITYQWRKGTTPINGATASSLTLNGLGLSDAGVYDVVVTTPCGAVTSQTAALAVNDGPTITQHPATQTVCVGGTVLLSVTAVGDAPITYQWRRDGFDMPGATGSSFTINNALQIDAGSYSCRVTNPCGNRISNTAVVSIGAGGPVINTQPSNTSACIGGQASFTVAATGSGTLSYQWRRNSNNINGATNATLTINPVTAPDGATYDCIVTDSCGSTPSNTAALSIGGVPPQITLHPVSQSSCAGQPVTFTVAANGNGVLSYVWRKGATPIPGATNNSYTIPSVAAGDVGSYDCVVTDNCGSSTSDAASLTVSGGGPTITQQPQNTTACIGSGTAFTTAAVGSGTVTYQWRKGGGNIPGANSPTLTINNVQAGDAGNYDCVVSDNCGTAFTNAASLTIGSGGPTITQQPQTGYGCVGGDFTFTIMAQGTDLAYLWRRGLTVIPGANGPSLTLTELTSQANGSYVCVVSNSCGTSISNPATLTVTVRGDADCSGVLTNFDIDPFVLHLIFGQAAWEAIYPCDFHCANDIDRNGAVTNFDIDPFVELLVAD